MTTPAIQPRADETGDDRARGACSKSSRDISHQYPAIAGVSRLPARRVSPYGTPMPSPERPLFGELTTLRPATEDDADLLVGWHADPEVARFWDDAILPRDEVLERLRRPLVDAYIIEEAGGAVGYLQAWFEDERFEMGGLDMFLIPSARGRGLGPDAARALARWLVDAGGLRRLTVDPYAWNETAIRAWAKAGFRSVSTNARDAEHRDAWVLMRWDPGPPAPDLPGERPSLQVRGKDDR
jgi:aminoglycoside 6'-N-acetyltransferase